MPSCAFQATIFRRPDGGIQARTCGTCGRRVSAPCATFPWWPARILAIWRPFSSMLTLTATIRRMTSGQHMFFGAESALGFGVRDAPPLASVLRSSSWGAHIGCLLLPLFRKGSHHSSDSTGFWEVECELLLLEVWAQGVNHTSASRAIDLSDARSFLAIEWFRSRLLRSEPVSRE